MRNNKINRYEIAKNFEMVESFETKELAKSFINENKAKKHFKNSTFAYMEMQGFYNVFFKK